MKWVCPKCRTITTAIPPVFPKNLYCLQWESKWPKENRFCNGILLRYDRVYDWLDEGGVFYFCPEILARDLASQMGYRI